MKTVKTEGLIIVVFFSMVFLAWGSSQKAEIRTIDGVKHVLNPKKPLQEIVSLEVEKTKEIDPYEQPEFGLRYFSKARDRDGNVILFGKGEAHRFSKGGRYLGLLFRKGQGPGEFPDHIDISFKGPEIWVSDYNKLARFNQEGKLLGEKKLGCYVDVFVEEGLFFESRYKAGGRSVDLVRFSGPGDSKNEFRTFIKMNKIIMFRDPSSSRSFAAVWVTPEILYAFDPIAGVFYGMMNDDYRVEVRDLNGVLKHVFEKPFKRIRLSDKDKEKLLYIRSEADRWKLKVCPDEMVVVYGIHVLPKGHVGVRRFISPTDSELDVFDQEGNFVYVLRHPEGIPFDRVDFHPSGFCTVLSKEDGFVYVDFKVKNLPSIFQ